MRRGQFSKRIGPSWQVRQRQGAAKLHEHARDEIAGATGIRFALTDAEP